MVLPLGGELDVLVSGLRVFEDFALVIADHDFFVVVVEDVTGIDGDFAAGSYFECKISKTRRGDKTWMPAKVLSTSKSSSPVTMRSARPAMAVARTMSSSGSRQMRLSNDAGLTTSERSRNNDRSRSSSGAILNLARSVRRSSANNGSDVMTVCGRRRIRTRSRQRPLAAIAAMSTFVSRTSLTTQR